MEQRSWAVGCLMGERGAQPRESPKVILLGDALNSGIQVGVL